MYLDNNSTLSSVYITKTNVRFVKVSVFKSLEIFNLVHIFDTCIVCGKKAIGEAQFSGIQTIFHRPGQGGQETRTRGRGELGKSGSGKAGKWGSVEAGMQESRQVGSGEMGKWGSAKVGKRRSVEAGKQGSGEAGKRGSGEVRKWKSGKVGKWVRKWQSKERAIH